MEWEVVIGLEVHVQLSTKSKIFSGAPAGFGAEPNTHSCPIDLALPGCLPVLNRGAVEKAIQFGLAIGATVAKHSVFDRKHYIYPDLPKGYQISQFELPVVVGGALNFVVEKPDGSSYEKTVRLTRAHLEEDAGKSVHGVIHGKTGIDLNRAGTPLLEIVSEPDIRSPEEAVAYAKTLHELVCWIGVSDGDMQKGNFRCDANISVRPKGQKEFGTRCEIKNLNSFRFLQMALEYEIKRQIDLINEGGKVIQATLLYDPDKDETREMRTKEDSMDYRYFPDPDLLPLEISEEWIDAVKACMPELPGQALPRLINQYGLKETDARILITSRPLMEYFESAAEENPDKKLVFNWIRTELLARLNAAELSIEQCPVSSKQLGRVLKRLNDGTINQKGAKTVFAAIWDRKGDDVDSLIDSLGLKQISDSGAIESVIDSVLSSNLKTVEEFKAGKEKAFNSLVGQVMRATKGKANPSQVNEILRKKLS